MRNLAELCAADRRAWLAGKLAHQARMEVWMVNAIIDVPFPKAWPIPNLAKLAPRRS